jgi:hypothetical protein
VPYRFSYKAKVWLERTPPPTRPASNSLPFCCRNNVILPIDSVSSGSHSEEVKIKELLYRPSVSAPTLLVFGVAWLSFLACIYYGPFVRNCLPWVFVIPLQSFSAFALFTVLHDAVHHSVSSNKWVNDSIGRLSIIGLGPVRLVICYTVLNHTLTLVFVDQVGSSRLLVV